MGAERKEHISEQKKSIDMVTEEKGYTTESRRKA
jgi:hypothetical protein